MAPRTIPPQEWPSFFDTLSHDHEGWLLAIERVGHADGDPEVHEHTLDSITTDLDEGESEIVIHLVDETPFKISEPERVRREETDDWQDDLVEIESGPQTTRLRFRFTEDPEMDNQ